jgi:hypothetical protein
MLMAGLRAGDKKLETADRGAQTGGLKTDCGKLGVEK